MRLPIALVISSAVAAGLYAFFRYYDYYFAISELAQAESAYKASGLPWTADDLRPYPPVAVSENAAPDILATIKLVPSRAFDYSKFTEDRIRQLRATNKHQELLNILDPFQDSLDKMVVAVKKPRFDSNPDWDLGEDLVFRELAHMRWFVKRLTFRAEANAGLGKHLEALRDLEAAWRLAHHIGQEPFTIFITASSSSQAVVLDSILRCASKSNFDQTSLTRLIEILLSREEPNLIAALRGEIYMGLAVLRKEKGIDSFFPEINSDLVGSMDNWIDDRFPARTRYAAIRVRYLQANAEIGHMLAKSNPDFNLLGRKSDEVIDRYEDRRGKSHRFVGFGFSIYTNGYLNSRSRRISTLSLLRNLQIKLETGKLSEAIDQIPGSWVDPFTSKPLKLVRKGNTIRIYSVGPDLKDEGGLAKSESKYSNDDIVMIYPPLPLKP